MIKHILAGVFSLMMIASAAIGQAREAIEDVIGQQLQAFNDRDVATAFSFASPMIKGMFRDPENFGMMVERGYPMVWDNADVRFLGAVEQNGVVMQTVMLKDEQGSLHTLVYAMIDTPNGWQINGVQLIEAELAA